MSNSTKQHWEEIYKTKDTTREVGWYQRVPKTSLDLIQSTNIDKNSTIIDIGGGDSNLVDELLKRGFKNIFVLDISGASLEKAKTRLGERAKSVTWVDSDILDFDTDARFDVWHDRGAFHFFSEKRDISRYVEIAGTLIKPQGYLIIATFSIHGSKRCSGLDVTQYSEDSIKKTFSKDFNHVRSFEETHVTPFNTNLIFLFSVLQRK